MTPQIERFGWVPDLPDQRDFKYAAPRPVLKVLPPKTDLRKHCPPVYDQGQLGSCTANAISAAFEFELMKANKSNVFMPSRLFIYYNERVMEHSVKSDSGAQLRNGIKSVNKQGVCTENLWPYHVQKFASKPAQSCYKDALTHQVLMYQSVSRSLNQMKGCLADGYPFVFGFTAYEYFESVQVAKTGKLNMPAKNEAVVGGHAVAAVGYNNAAKRFLIRNSWGGNWGMKGYFTMPYDYLLNADLSDDFWMIRVVEENPALQNII